MKKILILSAFISLMILPSISALAITEQDFIPSDFDLFMHLDVRKMINEFETINDLFNKIINLNNYTDEEIDFEREIGVDEIGESLDEIGVDIKRDIDKIFLGGKTVELIKSYEEEFPNVIIIIKGSFNRDRIYSGYFSNNSSSNSSSAQEKSYKGFRYVIDKNSTAGVLVYDMNYLIIAPENHIKTAIDTANGTITSVKGNNRKLSDFRRRTNNAEFWYLLLPGKELKDYLKYESGLDVTFFSLINGINDVSMIIDIENSGSTNYKNTQIENASYYMEVLVKADSEASKSIQQIIPFYLGLAIQGLQGTNEVLLGIIQSIRVNLLQDGNETAIGNSVELSFDRVDIFDTIFYEIEVGAGSSNDGEFSVDPYYGSDDEYNYED